MTKRASSKPVVKAKPRMPKAPKPCPECHRPMRLDGDVYACVTHGEPTRP